MSTVYIIVIIVIRNRDVKNVRAHYIIWKFRGWGATVLNNSHIRSDFAARIGKKPAQACVA